MAEVAALRPGVGDSGGASLRQLLQIVSDGHLRLDLPIAKFHIEDGFLPREKERKGGPVVSSPTTNVGGRRDSYGANGNA
jgi:hypothetical protein